MKGRNTVVYHVAQGNGDMGMKNAISPMLERQFIRSLFIFYSLGISRGLDIVVN
jgi:hypothetical protein